ncbi:MAG: YwqG family protein [Sphingopyxis sp.]
MTAELFGLLCAAIVVALVLVGPARRWLAERANLKTWRKDLGAWKAEDERRNPPGPPITDAEIAAIRAWFPAHALPAAELKPDPDQPIRPDGCRLGGPAWVADGAEWPLDAAARPMDFVAQIDFIDLPPLDGFTSRGMLQFFLPCEDIMGADFDEPANSAIRLVWHPAGLPAGRLVDAPPPPEPMGPLHDRTRARGVMLVASAARHEPAIWDYSSRGLLDGLWNRPNIKTVEDWYFGPDRREPIVHHVGGYPSFTQSDFREAGHYDDYDRTLLRLTSDAHIGWGDVGEAVFLIRAADLAARDFSRVAFSWDCH